MKVEPLPVPHLQLSYASERPAVSHRVPLELLTEAVRDLEVVVVALLKDRRRLHPELVEPDLQVADLSRGRKHRGHAVDAVGIREGVIGRLEDKLPGVVDRVAVGGGLLLGLQTEVFILGTATIVIGGGRKAVNLDARKTDREKFVLCAPRSLNILITSPVSR